MLGDEDGDRGRRGGRGGGEGRVVEEFTRFGMKQAILLVHSVYRLVCEGETGDVRGGGGGRHGPQCVVVLYLFVRAVSSFTPRCVVAVLLRLRDVCASIVSAIVHFYERACGL